MSPILCRAFTADDCTQVRTLFKRFRHDPGMGSFHPHPFTTGEAVRVTNDPKRDYYAGCWLGDCLVGYGMLRGWNAGFEIPMLGIGIDLNFRGRGLAPCLLQHLHAVAKARGAREVRLHVDQANGPAVALYQGAGYQLAWHDAHQYLGRLSLEDR